MKTTATAVPDAVHMGKALNGAICKNRNQSKHTNRNVIPKYN